MKKYTRRRRTNKPLRRRKSTYKRKSKQISKFGSTWHYQKCHVSFPVEHRTYASGTDITSTRWVVKWDDITDTSATDKYVACLWKSREFRALKSNYREISVQGVKMIWRPYFHAGGDAEMRAAKIFSNVDDFKKPTTNAGSDYWNADKMYQKPDYKEMKGTQTVKKYVNVRKFHEKRNAPINQRITNLAPTVHSTAFSLNSNGIAANHDMGRLTVEYYVIFKQP